MSFRACVKDVFLVSPPFPQPSPQSLAHGLHKNIAAGINEANSGADYGVSHAAPRCETSALGRPPWPECRPHWLRTVALLGTYPLIFYSAQQTAMACPILPSHFRAFWRTTGRMLQAPPAPATVPLPAWGGLETLIHQSVPPRARGGGGGHPRGFGFRLRLSPHTGKAFETGKRHTVFVRKSPRAEPQASCGHRLHPTLDPSSSPAADSGTESWWC